MSALAQHHLASDLVAAVIDLRGSVAHVVIDRDHVVDGLLDLRGLGAGIDIGLEFTVDEILRSLPEGPVVSSEWWRSSLAELAEYASYLET